MQQPSPKPSRSDHQFLPKRNRLPVALSRGVRPDSEKADGAALNPSPKAQKPCCAEGLLGYPVGCGIKQLALPTG